MEARACPNRMDFRERTGISFGPTEAYARRDLRVAPVIGTSVRLSLQEARTAHASPSSLRSLIEGTTLSLAQLRSLLPSLQFMTWSFGDAGDSATKELTTVSDGICVTLSVDDPLDHATPSTVEGSLRGLAARLVVLLAYRE